MSFRNSRRLFGVLKRVRHGYEEGVKNVVDQNLIPSKINLSLENGSKIYVTIDQDLPHYIAKGIEKGLLGYTGTLAFYGLFFYGMFYFYDYASKQYYEWKGDSKKTD